MSWVGFGYAAGIIAPRTGRIATVAVLEVERRPLNNRPGEMPEHMRHERATMAAQVSEILGEKSGGAKGNINYLVHFQRLLCYIKT